MSVIIPRKLLGDCRQTLPDLTEKSVHLCVTSPPYWGLRSYLPEGHPSKHLEIGNEPTFELYLEHILQVFRSVMRVLRDDGQLWINLGDRYTSGGRRNYDVNASSRTGQVDNHPSAGVMRPMDPPGLKKKELCMLPQLVAMALQRDGWYLRSMCPWIKRNCMPESTTDRPATALEYFFQFSKQERYFYDSFAVKKAASDNTHPRSAAASMFPSRQERDYANNRRRTPKEKANAFGSKQNEDFAKHTKGVVSSRNRRNTDWFMESWQGLLLDSEDNPMALVVNTKGTKIAHFASYPAKLIEPVILCATSEGGCCSQCGTPLERVLKDLGPDLEHQKACGSDLLGEYDGKATKDFDAAGVQNASDVKRRILAGMTKKVTVGFKPVCGCRVVHGIPCTVLDPFHGTGTTAEAAVRLGRNYIGCELSDEYFKDSDIKDSQTGMILV